MPSFRISSELRVKSRPLCAIVLLVFILSACAGSSRNHGPKSAGRRAGFAVSDLSANSGACGLPLLCLHNMRIVLNFVARPCGWMPAKAGSQTDAAIVGGASLRDLRALLVEKARVLITWTNDRDVARSVVVMISISCHDEPTLIRIVLCGSRVGEACPTSRRTFSGEPIVLRVSQQNLPVIGRPQYIDADALRRGFELPWQRVLGAGGQIKLPGEYALEQRMRLEAEGVRFRGRRVDMKAHEFKPPLPKKAVPRPTTRASRKSS